MKTVADNFREISGLSHPKIVEATYLKVLEAAHHNAEKGLYQYSFKPPPGTSQELVKRLGHDGFIIEPCHDVASTIVEITIKW